MRIQENKKCNPELMLELSTFMATENPFVGACKMMYEVEQECISDSVENRVEPTTVSITYVDTMPQGQMKLPLSFKTLTVNPL
jgi:hypothetical protein